VAVAVAVEDLVGADAVAGWQVSFTVHGSMSAQSALPPHALPLTQPLPSTQNSPAPQAVAPEFGPTAWRQAPDMHVSSVHDRWSSQSAPEAQIVKMQVPAEQCFPGAQAAPHAPQLFRSDVVSTHLPAHSMAHAPPSPPPENHRAPAARAARSDTRKDKAITRTDTPIERLLIVAPI